MASPPTSHTWRRARGGGGGADERTVHRLLFRAASAKAASAAVLLGGGRRSGVQEFAAYYALDRGVLRSLKMGSRPGGAVIPIEAHGRRWRRPAPWPARNNAATLQAAVPLRNLLPPVSAESATRRVAGLGERRWPGGRIDYGQLPADWLSPPPIRRSLAELSRSWREATAGAQRGAPLEAFGLKPQASHVGGVPEKHRRSWRLLESYATGLGGGSWGVHGRNDRRNAPSNVATRS